MLRSIPWDVWVAAAGAFAAALAWLFEPGAAIFVVGYLALCAYIVVQIINDETVG